MFTYRFSVDVDLSSLRWRSPIVFTLTSTNLFTLTLTYRFLRWRSPIVFTLTFPIVLRWRSPIVFTLTSTNRFTLTLTYRFYIDVNLSFLRWQQGGGDFQPVVVSRVVLKSLSRHDVIVCAWKKPLRYQYYKMIMPDVSITKCPACNKVKYRRRVSFYGKSLDENNKRGRVTRLRVWAEFYRRMFWHNESDYCKWNAP